MFFGIARCTRLVAVDALLIIFFIVIFLELVCFAFDADDFFLARAFIINFEAIITHLTRSGYAFIVVTIVSESIIARAYAAGESGIGDTCGTGRC